MIINPYKSKIQVELEVPKVGSLDLSSKPSAIEIGKVIAIGEEVDKIKVGDTIFFKAWQLDIIAYEGINYYFLDANSEGICAIIEN